MARIARKRDIIDRRALIAEIDARMASRDRPKGRAAIFDLFQSALDRGRAEIRARFEGGAGGVETAAAGAFLMDGIVRLLFDFASERAYPLGNPTAGERMAVVAVGGYGCGQMAPYSDVDLLFLSPYKAPAHTEQVVEFLLYTLWDLGLEVGHATRSLDDCIRLAGKDLTIRTGILEARYLAGDWRLFGQLRRRFAAEVMDGTALAFVTGKLAERDRRHRRCGDSRYVLEPNIKEGKGGLRDLHMLLWIARYVYRVDSIHGLIARDVLTAGEARSFAKAEAFLWTVRCHLHYLAGRAEDVLTFDVQPEMGRRLAYTDRVAILGVERFMKHYFLTAKTVGNLTRTFCAAVEAEYRQHPRASSSASEHHPVDGFLIEGGRLVMPAEDHFDRDPTNLVRLFHTSLNRNLDIHPKAMRMVTRKLGLIGDVLRAEPEANRLFMEILTSPKGPKSTLRRLNEAGVLGRFIPDFGRVVAQMQYDMYHVYTVDEHTIQAIDILSRIERGQLREDHPLSSGIVHKVLSRRVLYLALLLHDVAKGRGGNHPKLGAAIAGQLCPRLGLDAAETDTVAWLVQHHVDMSQFAFRRDLADPKTIRDFVELVQSPERLRLLLVLTVCDIRAVGPGVWNGWKAALLRDLYYRAEEVMSDGLATMPAAARVAAAQAALHALLPDWGEAELAGHLARMRPAYWLAADAEALAREARLVREAASGGQPFAIDVRVDRFRSITEVTVCARDRPGLFSRLAGAMAVSRASIMSARIATTADGFALDSFLIQRPPAVPGAAGSAFDDERRIAGLRTAVVQSLADELDPMAELADRPQLPARARHFTVPPRVLIDDRASATHTVVEVNGRDRAGLLYELTHALTELGLQISSAKISTFGAQVVDVFYVKDGFGFKISHPTRLETIRAHLLATLAGPGGETDAESDMAAAGRPVAVTE
jgi:[protein-PII] uridylyltransferase